MVKLPDRLVPRVTDPWTLYRKNDGPGREFESRVMHVPQKKLWSFPTIMGESTASRSPRRFTPAELFITIVVSSLLIVFLPRQIYSSFIHHDEYYDYRAITDQPSTNDVADRSSAVDVEAELSQVVSPTSTPTNIIT
jgi:hypothetical protein